MSDPRLTEVLYEVFEVVEAHFSAKEPRDTFVGLQGDKIVLLRSGGEHFALTLQHATVGASS